MLKIILASTAVLAAGLAHASTYDALSSFGVAGSAFTFGSGTGAGFTLSPDFDADGCSGVTGLACYDNHAGAYSFPAVGKNISASDPLTFYTNVLPKNLLFIQSLLGQVATVRFTAPTSSTYDVTGSFTRIDNSDGSGDGVDVGIVLGALSGVNHLSTTYLDTAAFGGPVSLNAGDTLDFYVDALTTTYNDGTGFTVTLSSVPEPATWGLMLAGFGMIGIAGRRRALKTA